jgi:hypothetical protein
MRKVNRFSEPLIRVQNQAVEDLEQPVKSQ